jgi:hypothetical protein
MHKFKITIVLLIPLKATAAIYLYISRTRGDKFCGRVSNIQHNGKTSYESPISGRLFFSTVIVLKYVKQLLYVSTRGKIKMFILSL